MEAAFPLDRSKDHWSEQLLAPVQAAGSTRVVFAHHGPVDHAMKERLMAQAEAYSLEIADSVVLRKRLFNVMVEGLDNLTLHTVSAHGESCFATLLDSGSGYRLFLGNTVPVSTAEMLAHRVQVLNDMSDTDLKEHFLMLLANDGRTERGGAGLGLVTMARKSGRGLTAHVIPLDQGHARLVMELALNRD
ncbi:MAG: hypothetical protein IPM46_09255 [Flavobacteriales bacterium]|nr:hypothetical protein [Flavobacteriales bacterium]